MKQVWYSEVTMKHYDSKEECEADENLHRNDELYKCLKDAERNRDLAVAVCNTMKSGALPEVEKRLRGWKDELRQIKAAKAGGPGRRSHGMKRKLIMLAGARYMEALRERKSVCAEYYKARDKARFYQAKVKTLKDRIVMRRVLPDSGKCKDMSGEG